MRSGLMFLLLGLFLAGAATGQQFEKVRKVETTEAKAEGKEAKDQKEAATGADFDQEKCDRETLKQGNLPNEGPALLKFFQTRTVTDAAKARLQELIRKLGRDDFDTREAASEEIERFGISAVGLLRQSERDEDAEVALRCERILGRIEKVSTSQLSTAAARLLAKHKPEGTADVLLNYLPLADDEMIAEEVRTTLAAVALLDGKPEPVFLKALASADALKRGAAAEALARGGNKELRVQMRDFLRKESDADARLYVALALVGVAKDREAVPDLIGLLGELPHEKAWRAEELLCQLAADNSPNVSLGSDAESRQKARDAWLEWWQKNGAKVDLAKLDVAERLFGYTLLMEMDVRGVGGRVMEVGADGKERWKLINLQFPADAVVLPGNKVLVAEQNANRVSERDMNNKELWGQNVNQPLNVQRLPNGHTVAIGRNQIFEWDANRKQVFQHNRPNFDIVAGRKLRNGDYVFLTQTGQCFRVDKDQKIVKQFNVGRVNYWAGIDVLPNNKILVTQWNAITEFDLDSGKSGWTAPFQQATSVQRLPNGNTLVTSMNRLQVVELDRNGKQVWTYKPADANYRPWRAKRR